MSQRRFSGRAAAIARLVRHSVMTPRTGEVRRPALVANGDLGVTFIGHSGFFLQMGGANLLIDPNFASWLFIVKRLRKPGLRIKDLPPIDYVLITHAHFDHLHRPSLRRIARMTRRRTGRTPTLIIPREVRDVVRCLGYRDVIEMQWWETRQMAPTVNATAHGTVKESLEVTHTPARHWGARMLKDYHRGFGGYVVRSRTHSLYHAGDTAYFQGFRDIGARLRPEIALLPIGAYKPASYRAVHTDPADAVRAFQDLGSLIMVPMHYGSFRLGHEPMDEPLQLLAHEASRAGVEERVMVLKEGVTQVFN